MFAYCIVYYLVYLVRLLYVILYVYVIICLTRVNYVLQSTCTECMSGYVILCDVMLW